MKAKYLLLFLILFAESCKKEEKPFDRMYFVECSYPITKLTEDFEGTPPMVIKSFIKIESNFKVINGNRTDIYEPMIFHNVKMERTLLDSLISIAKEYKTDTCFVNINSGRIYCGYPYCILLEKDSKTILIELTPYDLPPQMEKYFETLLKYGYQSNSNKVNQPTFLAFQSQLDSILKVRSKSTLAPPIFNKIKFVAPKVK